MQDLLIFERPSFRDLGQDRQVLKLGSAGGSTPSQSPAYQPGEGEHQIWKRKTADARPLASTNPRLAQPRTRRTIFPFWLNLWRSFKSPCLLAFSGLPMRPCASFGMTWHFMVG